MRIANRTIQFLFSLSFLILPLVASASGGHSESSDKEFSATELINSHIGDSHEFHIADWNGHAISLPLPIILWTDNGLEIFSASEFHHDNTGHHVAKDRFVRYNEVIFYADKFETLKEEDKSAFNFEARPLNFSITKNVFSMLMSVIILLVLFITVARSYKKNSMAPKGLAGFLEPLVIFVRDDIAIPNIGEKHYKKYMSFLLTIFFFIWFLNMFGLTPLGVNITGNLAITASLAILTFLITNFTANKNYWGHIFWMPGVPVPMKFILAPIELLGTIIKPFSLMIRLYANMVAGHIVLMSLIALMYTFNSPIGSPLSFFLAFVLSLLEILVALLQAYIFTMLAALYFGAAVEEHHHDEHHEAAHH